MLVIDKKFFMFNIKEVHFSDNPFDIEGCDYLNFCFCKNKVEDAGFTCQKRMTSVINLNQDLEAIWQKMDRTNTRYGIKRAEREGIKIRINDKYEEFFQIYQNFMGKKGLNSFFRIFGTNFMPLDNIKRNGTLFVADLNNEILGGILFVEDDSNIEGLIGASKRLEIEKEKNILVGCSNRLIWWEAIKYAKEKGIKVLDLGGLWPEEEAMKNPEKKGINSFKLKFGGDVVTRYSYQKICSRKLKLIYYLYNLTNFNKKPTL